jgi:hypothetical protein
MTPLHQFTSAELFAKEPLSEIFLPFQVVKAMVA